MNYTDILLLVGLALAILLSAFFSGIETGVISLSRIHLRQREEKGDQRAAMLSNLLRKPERLLATVLLGNNLVNVTVTMLFLIWTVRQMGISKAQYVTPLVITPILLIFGEILPKALFRHRADTLASAFARPLQGIMATLSPGVAALMRLTSRLSSSLGGAEKRSPFLSREDIRLMFIEGEEAGAIEEEEREMIKGVIDFGTTTAREIMVPRIDIVAVSDDAGWEEISDVFERSGHSRLPVYHEKIDEIIGMLYVFDLMRAGKPQTGRSIRELIRPVAFVPESKKVQDLLHEFRQRQMFMAIVVDEYGGTAGLATLEDVLEEIFGEIHDEYDVEELPVANVGEGRFVFDARMHKDEAEELLGAKLPEGEYETVGGFVLEKLGRIPRKGESFQYNNFQVTILDATSRAVSRVKFQLTPAIGKDGSKKKK